MNLEQILARARQECRHPGEKINGIPDKSEIPVFNMQNRVSLRNYGSIDPDNINEYIVRGGYGGLSRVLRTGREEAIKELGKSGLTGRGGGGFFTAEKWRICQEAESDDKYIVGDAVDADPDARTARLLIESDPHSVIEGLLIGAFAVGARHGFICINTDYTNAINRLVKALEQAREYGLLGEGILDTDFSCDIEIKEAESALVSGEETALIRSLENRQAIPYLRPPYPAISGYQGCPTLVHSAETLVNVAAVFQGVAAAKTKIVTLAGDITHPYTVEVPFGTTLRSIVNDIGGGTSSGKDIKAVQFGGPTGRLFAADSLDVQISCESIHEAGGIMGSGTIKVFASDCCAVETSRDMMNYLQGQSCGKCAFCREGTYQLAAILSDIAGGKGKAEDLEMIVEICAGMKNGSICGLGRTAPDPVLSSIELFRDEYEAHIKEKKCPKQ
jgi:NADH-quinone oxidoreductase subunit F